MPNPQDAALALGVPGLPGARKASGGSCAPRQLPCTPALSKTPTTPTQQDFNHNYTGPDPLSSKRAGGWGGARDPEFLSRHSFPSRKGLAAQVQGGRQRVLIKANNVPPKFTRATPNDSSAL